MVPYSADYCRAALKVFSAILEEGKTEFSLEEGKELAGDHWLNIVREMKYSGAGADKMGAFRVKIPTLIEPLRAVVKANLDRFSKDESDRKLDRRYKLKGTRYGRWSLFISLLSMLLSLLSLYKQGVISF